MEERLNKLKQKTSGFKMDDPSLLKKASTYQFNEETHYDKQYNPLHADQSLDGDSNEMCNNITQNSSKRADDES